MVLQEYYIREAPLSNVRQFCQFNQSESRINDLRLIFLICVQTQILCNRAIEVMAKAKNHTDNIDSVTLGNIESNSALVKRFMTDCDIS